ncbi:MAG TPA: peptidylprolyl isomerase [Candidatus Marinimicrobia bacterium]|jgi:parvulin-like peptidyl-prolyl isomerase|nr:peptidylprolyl isomerase [Candidatus Neomarinimicrobiota bacterium]|tara:strand:+ start:3360 stop:5198 length:1839 start_codon:yes stop_codon:yes gene_type:complete
MALMTSMRNRMHIVLWGLLIMFLLSMTVGGLVGGANILDQLFGRIDPSTAIGAVNGEIISPGSFSRLVGNRADQARAEGQTVDSRKLDQIRKQVWDSIIRDYLVAQKVKELKIVATDDEVIYHMKNNPPAFLKSNPEFQTLGQFDQVKYDLAISSPEGNEWAPLEKFMKDTYIPDYKLRQILFSSISATEQEVISEFTKRNIKYTIEAVHVTNAMVNSDSLKPSDKELLTEYNSRSNEFEKGETRTLNYIVWKKDPSKNDSILIKEEAFELKSKIDAGEDFAELANIYTDDPSNQVNPDSGKGGDLGFFGKGQMVPAFEEAAFSAKPNEVVGPVLSAFGYHIIKVFEKKNEAEEEQVHAAHILLKINSSPSTLDELRRKAILFSYDAQDYGFDTAVDTHQVEIQSAENLAVDGNFISGIGFFRSAIRFAFNSKLEEVSDPLENDKYYIVATLDSISPPGVKLFDEVKTRITRDLTNKITKEKTEVLTQTLMENINNGMTIDELVDQYDNLERVKSDSKTLNRSFESVGKSNHIVGALLGALPGDILGPLQTSKGHAIIHVMEIAELDTNQFKIQKDGIRSSIVNQKQNRAFSEWLDHQKAEAEILDNRNFHF